MLFRSGPLEVLEKFTMVVVGLFDFTVSQSPKSLSPDSRLGHGFYFGLGLSLDNYSFKIMVDFFLHFARSLSTQKYQQL